MKLSHEVTFQDKNFQFNSLSLWTSNFPNQSLVWCLLMIISGISQSYCVWVKAFSAHARVIFRLLQTNRVELWEKEDKVKDRTSDQELCLLQQYAELLRHRRAIHRSWGAKAYHLSYGKKGILKLHTSHALLSPQSPKEPSKGYFAENGMTHWYPSLYAVYDIRAACPCPHTIVAWGWFL